MIAIQKIFIFLFVLLLQVTLFQALAQQQDEGTHEDWEYVLESSGDILMVALPLVAGITTIVKRDWQGTKQFAFSFATTFILTHGLKRIVQKPRPEGRDLYDAFPSGHTSSAFSGASFIQRRYGWKYGKWAYVLAGIVGVSRVEGPDGWHDYWDVLAGAAIGIVSTYIFTKPYEEQKINLSFVSDGDTHLLTFRYKF